jgi:hypothetical protein
MGGTTNFKRRALRVKKSIVFLSFLLCNLIVQPVYASTIVYFVDDSLVLDVASFDFDVLDTSHDETDFIGTWPTGWMELSNNDTVSAFDTTKTTSLPTGQVGYFEDNNVELGNWVIGNQEADVLIQGVDYSVSLVGDTYTVAQIPIPGAIWLLGSALAGLIGIRRRRVKRS